MLLNMVIGCILMAVTTATHAIAMMAALRWLTFLHDRRRTDAPGWLKACAVASLVLIMFIVTVVEAAMWAVTFLLLGALSEFEQSLYFSTVTYTTLGYGDVVLVGRWRLLGAFEAANGIIMFGWTTALIVTAVKRVYSSPTTTEGQQE